MALLLGTALMGCDDALTDVDTTHFQNCAVTAYQIGSTVSGTLSSSDCRLVVQGHESGEFVDYYAFTLGSTATVTIDMSSTQLDAFLYLWSRDGQVVAWDDDSGPGLLDARIVASLPAGDYVIGATSFWDGETGSYTLSSN